MGFRRCGCDQHDTAASATVWRESAIVKAKFIAPENREAIVPKQWPWPDNQVDRARRIALSYRQLIEMALDGKIDDPRAALDLVDAKWDNLGESWVTPTQPPIDPDAWLTPAEIADQLHITARSLRDMHRAGHVNRIECNGRQYRYLVGDVIRYEDNRRRQR